MEKNWVEEIPILLIFIDLFELFASYENSASSSWFTLSLSLAPRNFSDAVKISTEILSFFRPGIIYCIGMFAVEKLEKRSEIYEPRPSKASRLSLFSVMEVFLNKKKLNNA